MVIPNILNKGDRFITANNNVVKFDNKIKYNLYLFINENNSSELIYDNNGHCISSSSYMNGEELYNILKKL